MDQVNVNETIRISARHFMLFGPGPCSKREKRSSECDWNLSGRDDNVERTKQALGRSVFFSVIKEFVAIFTRLERIHPINHVRMALTHHLNTILFAQEPEINQMSPAFAFHSFKFSPLILLG